jgi:hypothetical protein
MTERTAFESETRERLNRMERELRRWRCVGIFAFGLAALMIAGAAGDKSSPELSVHTLRIVDTEGKDRIVLTAKPGVPDMTFLDPGGKSRLTLDIAEDHKPILLFSENGKECPLTLELEQGLPLVQLRDEGVTKRLTIGIPRGSEGPVMRFLKSSGEYLKSLP